MPYTNAASAWIVSTRICEADSPAYSDQREIIFASFREN